VLTTDETSQEHMMIQARDRRMKMAKTRGSCGRIWYKLFIDFEPNWSTQGGKGAWAGARNMQPREGRSGND
jgi:hypothetical protein